jgi:peptidoglycan hydrolase-like protein with peptidoglycan-binding domain
MFLFKKKPKINIEKLGLIEDPRSVEEKLKDYRSEEIAMVAPIKWVEKSESEWRKFPVFSQNQSSSCVAQATAKALGIENYLEEQKFVHFSARDIYVRRMNYPGEGMYFADALNIGYKFGATVEQLMPSQGLSESAMNILNDRTPLTEIIAKVGKGGNYFSLPVDIESIASIVEPSGKPVIIGVRFGPNEWFGKKVPEVLNPTGIWGHGICVTNAILYQGKKALIIEDSAYYDANKEAVRIITEDWFKSYRIVFAGYFSFLQNTGTETKPKYLFNKDLKYGMTNNNDIKKLQECLAYLKLFPNRTEFTGNFYGLTLKGVIAFQVLNSITPSTGLVGPTTRAKLNELFSV